MAKGIKGFQKGHPSYLTKESKIKISKTMKGRFFSKEHRKKLSLASIGNKKAIGNKNGHWLGGKSFEKYTIDWTNTLKRAIRERDHYNCIICGEQQGETTFCVHHIDYNKKNCNPDNLITICRRCHTKTNFNRNYWIKYFKNIIKIN